MASGKGELVWILDRRAAVLSVLAFAFLVRVLVSLHPYSGEGTPPRYGDYEAQRHWMEITLNTPVKEWYKNTTNNDLKYWGLDYPPLTAYQSYVHGLALQAFEPQSVALHTSRGYETPSSKLLMRWTVLSSDVFIFFPAVLWFIFAYYQGMKDEELAWALAMVFLQPCLILIDHGHFQVTDLPMVSFAAAHFNLIKYSIVKLLTFVHWIASMIQQFQRKLENFQQKIVKKLA